MQPLAERMRPQSLNDYVGQSHIIKEGSPLRKNLAKGIIPSIILWGPPGVGKTTLAKIIAEESKRPFYILSAVSSGVKDVRSVIEKSKKASLFNENSPLLFIDEIHRFSKSQQDSLLAAVEDGTLVLVGATTENPSFEVISPLLSRCQVYVLKHLETVDLDRIVKRALEQDVVLSKQNVIIKEKEALYRFSGGDARKLLNILELILNSLTQKKKIITNKKVVDILQSDTTIYDKNGEMHYDIISAFIKSIRGSDPNAAVYWLARMIAGGEDVKFIARRLIILAAEDIGLANPNALLIANQTFQAVSTIGLPEARIVLSEASIYLANSPKSNSAYLAIDEALQTVKETGSLSVPLSLRNAPTKLMKDLGYAKDYKYAHDFTASFVNHEFMPKELTGKSFYKAKDNTRERADKDLMKKRWGNKYLD